MMEICLRNWQSGKTLPETIKARYMPSNNLNYFNNLNILEDKSAGDHSGEVNIMTHLLCWAIWVQNSGDKSLKELTRNADNISELV
jgi:hypothetical protein